MCIFLMDGVFRGFLADANGKDITDCLVFQAGMPLTPGPDMESPAQISIEALERSRALCIPISQINRMMAEYGQIGEIYQKFLQVTMQMHWELKQISYQYTAMQRYEWFLQHYPGMIDRIGHKYIASFLNMTPVTLSRLVNAPK